ncbi:MAG: TylF/MycF/NovP-related O-methyltransferase, partial [Acidimicrobiales bacterium]|nr:TylF/MycF/NovP-related O-methyltransferase [Acidimicrobiales bacterium]
MPFRRKAATVSDHRKAEPPVDVDAHTRRVIEATAAFTLTPHARVIALVDAVRYVANRGVPGAIVECGVWRGGSMMAVAMTLLEQGDTSRDLYLFDTFTEMPPSGPQDYLANGQKVVDLQEGDEVPDAYAYLPIEAVREAM